METVSFPRNRKKTLKSIFIYSAVFIVMVLILLYSTAVISNEIIPKGIAMSSAFILIIAYFLFKAVTGLNDTSPLISLQPDGIISRVTPMSKAAGLMLWTDVADLGIKDMGSDVLVKIALRNEQYYAARIKKSLSSIALKDAKDEQGNLTVFLTASEMDIDARELLNRIQDYKNLIK
jgi:hypothetical protein